MFVVFFYLKKEGHSTREYLFQIIPHRSKHIDVRYHFIREKHEEGCFKLNYVSSKNMIADVFTKSLPYQQFKQLRAAMNVQKYFA